VSICQLTDRDIKIILYVHENKVATTKQILRDVFKVNSGSARQRLMLLRLDGFLDCIGRDEDGDKSIIYSISKRSLNLLSRLYPELVFMRIHRSSSITHDLRLLDIKMSLTGRCIVTGYWSENQLNSSQAAINDLKLAPYRAMNSDAVIRLENGKGHKLYCALEYEASVKSQAEYLSKMSTIYSTELIQMVLYVCRTPEIESRLKKSEQEYVQKGAFKIYFTQLEKITNENSKVTFVNQESNFLEVY
jgi:hypothetical protein